MVLLRNNETETHEIKWNMVLLQHQQSKQAWQFFSFVGPIHEVNNDEEFQLISIEAPISEIIFQHDLNYISSMTLKTSCGIPPKLFF